MYVKVPRLELPRIINWEMIKIFAKEYTGARPGLVKTEPTINRRVTLGSFPAKLLQSPASSDYIITLSGSKCFGVTDSYSHDRIVVAPSSLLRLGSGLTLASVSLISLGFHSHISMRGDCIVNPHPSFWGMLLREAAVLRTNRFHLFSYDYS